MAESPVDWALAERIAVKFSGSDPLASSYHYDSLAPDFQELTAIAEQLVTAETGLVPDGHAEARVIDRAGWIRANISSFQKLLAPITETFGEALAKSPAAPVMRRATAAEVGMMLGWMSSRVLGQYDLLVADDDGADDLVYYVGPNILALEKRFAFPPREFRMWIALHEVTHRAQFTGVPWMRDHFLGLVDQTLSAVEPDPARLFRAAQKVVTRVLNGKHPIDEGGLMSLLATDAQLAAMDQVAGLMSVLEGHGDVTMDRAGAADLPSAARFGHVLRNRRSSVRGMTKLIYRLIGFEAKMNQYEAGEHFIEAIEAQAGRNVINRVWESPAHVPSIAEVREPDLWLARLGLVSA